MVTRLVDRFDSDQIILFVCRPRHTAGSDVDCGRHAVDRFGRHEATRECRVALHEIAVAKDIILATPTKCPKRRDIVGTIIRTACARVRYSMLDLDDRLASPAQSAAKQNRSGVFKISFEHPERSTAHDIHSLA